MKSIACMYIFWERPIDANLCWTQQGPDALSGWVSKDERPSSEKLLMWHPLSSSTSSNTKVSLWREAQTVVQQILLREMKSQHRKSRAASFVFVQVSVHIRGTFRVWPATGTRSGLWSLWPLTLPWNMGNGCCSEDGPLHTTKSTVPLRGKGRHAGLTVSFGAPRRTHKFLKKQHYIKVAGLQSWEIQLK